MTTGENSLLQAWRNVHAERGGAAAIYGARREILRTFSELEAEAAELEAGELSRLSAGAAVAIQIGNHPAWAAALLACWRLGLTALPLERTITVQERDAALRVCNVAALITAESADRIAVTHVQHEPVEWGDHAPVLLKLTSGTTAAPRAIRFRADQLLADCVQICDTMEITADDVNFGVIPVSHSYGFSNLLTPLLVRGVPLVLSSDRMPRAVLDDLARTGATVFPGMPVFYQAFCELPDAPALPDLRLCISAGAPLSLPVAQKFRDRFGLAIHSFYGSSECGGICYDRDALLVEQGFVGSPMSGVELELLEPEASASRIRVRTAAAGDGYFPEPDEEKLGDGWFARHDRFSHRRPRLRCHQCRG
jgi:acyl-CoA synthetase (AMP-forming)/AMP-acid ligase II